MDIDADEHPGDSHARLKTEMWAEVSSTDVRVGNVVTALGDAKPYSINVEIRLPERDVD